MTFRRLKPFLSNCSKETIHSRRWQNLSRDKRFKDQNNLEIKTSFLQRRNTEECVQDSSKSLLETIMPRANLFCSRSSSTRIRDTNFTKTTRPGARRNQNSFASPKAAT